MSDVELIEVSPRDGLQSEPTLLATAQKLELIAKLIAAGLQYLFEQSGHQTGVDLRSLIAGAHWLGSTLGHELPGMVSKADGP